jgi:sulfoxide reductase heme-binding subunit YedZ
MPWLKPGIFWGGLFPAFSLALRLRLDALGANPIAQIENELGLTALVLVIASMACTPAKLLWGWTWQMRVRRELGLFGFFYAVTHFGMYVIVDQRLDVGTILGDIAQRPFITVGFAALVILVPIAVTSTNDWIKRLGYKRWLRLHQLVYLAGGLAVLHFIWRVKLDVTQPLLYAAVLGALLTVRAAFWWRKRATGAR